MKTYTDPVFMPSECNRKDILAAYDPEYHKAMIISDTGIEEHSIIKKDQEVSVIYPSASTKEEQARIVKNHTDYYGVKINQLFWVIWPWWNFISPRERLQVTM